MKKLFGKSKNKTNGSKDLTAEETGGSIPTPIHATHARYLTKQRALDQQLQQQQQPSQPPPQSLPLPASSPLPTPPLAVAQIPFRSPADEERWEIVSDSPQKPIATIVPPSRSSSFNSVPSPHPRPASPTMTNSSLVSTTRPGHPLDIHTSARPKKSTPAAPVALGILKALDPHSAPLRISEPNHYVTRSQSDERFLPPDRYSGSENGHAMREGLRDPTDKKEKRGFWTSSKDKDKDRGKEKELEQQQREREREARQRERERHQLQERGRDQRREIVDESQAELTRMIGYLTATSSEDWAVVLDVCDRASANEANAKEAARALRREFKYGEPPAQLSAVRLWAIMLRNSNSTFINQSRSRKFLDTLEQLLTSQHTSPVVRERLLEVIAAAAFASGRNKSDQDGFRGLWRRVKPIDKPDEGIPFDSDDSLFHPPASGRLSHHEVPMVSYQQPSPLVPDAMSPTPPPMNLPRKRKSPNRNRIIPPEEDIRRLFQECKIGQGNASLLSQALASCKPEDIKKSEIINEFYMKSQSSQELIFAQIEWASAGAERSRVARNQEKERLARERTVSTDSNRIKDDETREEKLLAALLASNAELLEALRQYDDLIRVYEEKKAEARSRKETRMDRRDLIQQGEFVGGSGSRSPSPSSRSPSPSYGSNISHQRPYQLALDNDNSSLAPPPAAPHGPRSPGQQSIRSRTPSPNPDVGHVNGYGSAYEYHHQQEDTNSSLYHTQDQHSDINSIYEGEDETPIRPSAKALGKRKVAETATLSESSVHSGEDLYFDKEQTFQDDRFDSDDDSNDGRTPIHYVYDAAAERTQQRLEEAARLVNGVH